MLTILAMSIVTFCGRESKEPSAESEIGKTAPGFTLANYDRDGKTGRAYGAKTTPHMFVIDTEGKIAYAGAIDNSPLSRKVDSVINYVDKALAELTEGKAVTISNTDPYGCSVKYADSVYSCYFAYKALP